MGSFTEACKIWRSHCITEQGSREGLVAKTAKDCWVVDPALGCGFQIRIMYSLILCTIDWPSSSGSAARKMSWGNCTLDVHQYVKHVNLDLGWTFSCSPTRPSSKWQWFLHHIWWACKRGQAKWQGLLTLLFTDMTIFSHKLHVFFHVGQAELFTNTKSVGILAPKKWDVLVLREMFGHSVILEPGPLDKHPKPVVALAPQGMPVFYLNYICFFRCSTMILQYSWLVSLYTSDHIHATVFWGYQAWHHSQLSCLWTSNRRLGVEMVVDSGHGRCEGGCLEFTVQKTLGLFELIQSAETEAASWLKPDRLNVLWWRFCRPAFLQVHPNMRESGWWMCLRHDFESL